MCARGAIVDEQALVEALQKGRIRGAVLDVFTMKLLPSTSPLYDLEKVLISAHSADIEQDSKAKRRGIICSKLQ